MQEHAHVRDSGSAGIPDETGLWSQGLLSEQSQCWDAGAHTLATILSALEGWSPKNGMAKTGFAW